MVDADAGDGWAATEEAEAHPQLREVGRDIATSCETGACAHIERPVFSNIAVDDPRAIAAQSAFGRSNVERQEQNRKEYLIATNEALERAQSLVDAGRGAEMMAVRIDYSDEAFDIRALRGAPRGSARRAEILERRSIQLARLRKPLQMQFEARGVQVIVESELGSWVEARIPAKDLEHFARLPFVVRIDADITKADDVVNADSGRDRRLTMGMPDDAYRSVGIDGGSGGNNPEDIVLAIIETDTDDYYNGVNPLHAAYEDWNGGPSRILQTYECKWEAFKRNCRSGRAVNTIRTLATHGNLTTAVAAASLEQGQDLNLSAAQRVEASGIATEANIYYFLEFVRADLVMAIEKAVALGADVISLSLGDSDSDTWCKNDSFSGIREAFEDATDAGVLMVNSAGNNQIANEDVCNINFQSTFPDSLAVGGLWLADGILGNTSTTPIYPNSSRGTFSSTNHKGQTTWPFIVDLIAPAQARFIPSSGTAGSEAYDATTYVGTSISAPIVAGSAAILKDWARMRGGLPGGLTEDPYAIRVLLSLMGDGRDSSSQWLNYTSGFGALRFINFDTEVGSGAWGVQRRVMVPGQVVDWSIGTTGPESTAVKGWKFAALIDRNRYGGTPYVNFSLVDKCPAGGGETTLFTWKSTGHKSRFRMASSILGSRFHNRCMWMRAALPSDAGENVELYTADYFYTNERVNHDYD
jgi:hypothetical protein